MCDFLSHTIFSQFTRRNLFKRQNCILYIGICIYRTLRGAAALHCSGFETATGTWWNMLCVQTQRLPRVALSHFFTRWEALTSWSLVQAPGSGPRVFYFLCFSFLIPPGSSVVGCWVGNVASMLWSNWLHSEAWLPACHPETYAEPGHGGMRGEPGTRWDVGNLPSIPCSPLCSGNCLPISELCARVRNPFLLGFWLVFLYR